MFDIKNLRLEPGTLVSISDPGITGSLGIVVEHTMPALVTVLVGGTIVKLDFRGRVPVHGWVSEISLIAPSPVHGEPKLWYPELRGKR